MTSSPHGPYGLGYTRATMVVTMGNNPKDWGLQAISVIASALAGRHLDTTFSSVALMYPDMKRQCCSKSSTLTEQRKLFMFECKSFKRESKYDF